MKNIPRKFSTNIFVKPLYRKVKPKIAPGKDRCVFIDVDNTIKLCGDGFGVKRNIVSGENSTKTVLVAHHNNNTKLPSSVLEKRDRKSFRKCDEENFIIKNKDHKNNYDGIEQKNVFIKKPSERLLNNHNMLGIIESTKVNLVVEDDEVNPRSNSVKIVVQGVSKWLRVFPAPRAPGETICSVVFRCLISQIGLTTLLCIWSIIWMIIINHFEGPYEHQVSEEFSREQTQLVIQLATELRMVTPLSPKWRSVIEARIEEARRQTVLAVGRGARLHPGQFWNMSGTFLFTIYVMTALGFGAPVPQTTGGRTAAIIYAALAVPVHIIIMVNASACVVVQVEAIIRRVKEFFRERLPCMRRENAQSYQTGLALGSPSHSRNSTFIKSTTGRKLRRKLLRFLAAFCVGRCVPLATLLYYAFGAVAFGVLRAKKPLEIVMFPLEFTTSGGLEHVEEYVRVLYGIYVEGAMTLLACGLATLGRHSDAAVENMSKKYRMFVYEKRPNI